MFLSISHVDYRRVANTRDLSNAAFALLLPARGPHFMYISSDFDVFGAQNDHLS